MLIWVEAGLLSFLVECLTVKMSLNFTDLEK